MKEMKERMIQAGLVYDSDNNNSNTHLNPEEIAVAEVIEESKRSICSRLSDIISKFYMSWIIFFLCVLMYVGMAASDGEYIKMCSLHNFQARWGPSMINHAQMYRLITALFIHQNPIHLGINLSGIIYVCFIIENKVGHVLMPLIFLVIGCLAGLTSTLVNPYLLACGASGPIIGFIGLNFLIIMFEDHSKMEHPKTHRVVLGGIHIMGLVCTFVADMVSTTNTDASFHWFSLLAAFFIWMAIFPLNLFKYAKWVDSIYYKKQHGVMGVFAIITWIIVDIAIATTMSIKDFTVCDPRQVVITSTNPL